MTYEIGLARYPSGRSACSDHSVHWNVENMWKNDRGGKVMNLLRVTMYGNEPSIWPCISFVCCVIHNWACLWVFPSYKLQRPLQRPQNNQSKFHGTQMWHQLKANQRNFQQNYLRVVKSNEAVILSSFPLYWRCSPFAVVYDCFSEITLHPTLGCVIEFCRNQKWSKDFRWTQI